MIKLYNISFIFNQTDQQLLPDNKKINLKQQKISNRLKSLTTQYNYILNIRQDLSYSKNNIQTNNLQIILTKSSHSTHIIYQPTGNHKQFIIKSFFKNISQTKLSFQFCKFQQKSTSQFRTILFYGQALLNGNKQSLARVPVYDNSNNQVVKGHLSFNYILQDQNIANLNIQKKSLELYIFSIKIYLFDFLKYKRAFLTLSQSKPQKNKEQNPQNKTKDKQNIVQKVQQREQGLDIKRKQKIKNFPFKRIQKGWIWYPNIFDYQVQLQQKDNQSTNIQLNLFSFDYNSGQKNLICSYKGPLYIDFNKSDQIKFTQLQMFDYQYGSDDTMATIEFKYCLKSAHNYRTVNLVNSKTYLQNSFSPSQFMYDNNSFISNLSIAKDKKPNPNQSLYLSHKSSLLNSSLLNLNKMNRNIFVKSKFHSIFSSNQGIAIDRQQRFPSPKKKLTDQLGYYAHQTIDINSLPKRQRYRYASFGKDQKQCLKKNAFQFSGPGSARYKLPSIFDKY